MIHSADPQSPIIMQTEKVCQTYPGIQALDAVDYQVYRNKVNVLIGENGAGKSTMMKLLAGVEYPSAGTIRLNGQPVSFSSIAEAEKQGISIIFQELNLFPNLSVADNIFITREHFHRGCIDQASQWQQAKKILERLGLDIDPDTLLGELGIGHQQMVEIARALSKNARVLIMDEPTSALSQSEVRMLFHIIEDLKHSGVTLIYISHRLEELIEIGDHITVLRDGKFVAEALMKEVDIPWIIEKMVGSKRRRFEYQSAEKGDEVLQVRDLTLPKEQGGYWLDHVSFSLCKGEVIGIYGLLGAGRTELFKSIMGFFPYVEGDILAERQRMNHLSYSERLYSGLSLVPEDRQREGMVQLMTIQSNMTLACQGKGGFWNMFKPIHDRGEQDQVASMVDQLAIKVGSTELPITSLSGGNQQKVVLGKALLTSPKVVFLDEPTRGIDVGAKADVYRLIGQLAQQGLAVMFSSSELDEVISLADRIFVMADGRLTADIPHHQASREDIIRASTPQH